MLEILTVCTGNICRSPLAEQLLRARLAPIPVRVHSAGTRGLRSVAMTPEAARLAAGLGVAVEDSASHRSRYLTESHLGSPDLILTMTRGHRRDVAELAPSRLRATFTVREFARLAEQIPDADLQRAADEAGMDAAARVRAVAIAVASHRGLVPAPVDPADDDVIDPYGRSWATYELSAAQLVPAVDEVVRVLRLAAAPGARHTDAHDAHDPAAPDAGSAATPDARPTATPDAGPAAADLRRTRRALRGR